MKRIQDAKILLVDDNHELLALLTDELESAGYHQLATADSVATGWWEFDRQQPDLVVLDINLPDGDGFGLFRAIRTKADVPVLFLSARDADSDRLFGLGLGADDYLTKPFLTQELLLRIQLILRRFYRVELQKGETAQMALGERSVHLEDASVTTPEGVIPLTAIERTILQKLAENRGHIVTYDALCEAVWGKSYYGYENSLSVHIRHLREKLEETPSQPQWLVTVRGIGYKLKKEAVL